MEFTFQLEFGSKNNPLFAAWIVIVAHRNDIKSVVAYIINSEL